MRGRGPPNSPSRSRPIGIPGLRRNRSATRSTAVVASPSVHERSTKAGPKGFVADKRGGERSASPALATTEVSSSVSDGSGLMAKRELRSLYIESCTAGRPEEELLHGVHRAVKPKLC